MFLPLAGQKAAENCAEGEADLNNRFASNGGIACCALSASCMNPQGAIDDNDRQRDPVCDGKGLRDL
jgi:hypothetical protein